VIADPDMLTGLKANIESIESEIKNLTAELSPDAFSVWSVIGAPQEDGGALGPHRALLLLLPVLSEVGHVINGFIQTCSRTDGTRYKLAQIDRAQYVGWAWLPGSEPK
jgi:hypothetical protein